MQWRLAVHYTVCNLFVPLLLCALGMGGVYLGIGFLNGILWPQVFGALYAATESPVLRIIAAFPIFFGPFATMYFS